MKIKIFSLLIFMSLSLQNCFNFFPDENYYALKLYEKLQYRDYINAPVKLKEEAYNSMVKYSKVYSLTQKEIYRIIEKETGKKFHIMALNKRTKAKGLGGITEIAWKDIPLGKKFLFDDRRIYYPQYNILAICQYYSKCKKWSRERKIGRWYFTKDEVARMYYVQGRYRTESYFFGVLQYAQE